MLLALALIKIARPPCQPYVWLSHWGEVCEVHRTLISLNREYLNFRGPVAIWRPPTQNAVARFSLRSPNLTATVIVLKTSLPGSLGQRTRPLITGTLIVLTLNWTHADLRETGYTSRRKFLLLLLIYCTRLKINAYVFICICIWFRFFF